MEARPESRVPGVGGSGGYMEPPVEGKGTILKKCKFITCCNKKGMSTEYKADCQFSTHTLVVQFVQLGKSDVGQCTKGIVRIWR